MKRVAALAAALFVTTTFHVKTAWAHNIKNPWKAVVHADQVERFFELHKRLAHTPAGRRALRAHRWLHDVRTNQLPVTYAIRYVFGPWSSQALSVSWCESKWRTWASNGQYLGLFQMGSSERAHYGHGYTAYTQAMSAYRYFSASGKDWSPWSCKP